MTIGVIPFPPWVRFSVAPFLFIGGSFMSPRAQILLFTGENCPACDVVKPRLKKIAAKHKVKVVEIDPTENTELAQQYNVNILPSIVYKEFMLEGNVWESDIETIFD
jgi:thiol-disulfide isomerase/thioredoxin